MPPLPESSNSTVLPAVKGGWNQLQMLMKWFTKLVKTAYGWSDSIIKGRQKKADNRYKIEKAEKEARRIMAEQAAQRNATGLNKRAFVADTEECLARFN